MTEFETHVQQVTRILERKFKAELPKDPCLTREELHAFCVRNRPACGDGEFAEAVKQFIAVQEDVAIR